VCQFINFLFFVFAKTKIFLRGHAIKPPFDLHILSPISERRGLDAKFECHPQMTDGDPNETLRVTHIQTDMAVKVLMKMTYF